MSELQRQLEALEESNRELERRLAEAPQGGDDSEWKQRYELAMQDVQELKQRNEELLRKLEKADLAVRQSCSGSDWESLKRKMLMQLEDFDDSTPEGREEKMTIEGSMKIMDEVMAEKDAEIEELKRMLAEQSSRVGDVAVGAAAIAEMLDQDELIREERANLKRLQEEWREKLRQAEVELATERARIARERADVEEQLAELRAERKRLEELGGAPESSGDPGNKKTAKGGRWLARLGLQRDDG